MSIGSDGGIVAVFGHAGAAPLALAGLRTLRHRGTHGALVAADNGQLELTRLPRIPGDPVRLPPDPVARCALAAVSIAPRIEGRSTAPAVAMTVLGRLALATTGRLVNALSMERDLLGAGALLHDGSDAELLLHLVAQSSQRTLVNRLVDALLQARGGFAAVLMADDRLVAARDPHGLRPLAIGRRGSAVLLASESCAIAGMGGTEIREVEPGEMVILDREGMTSLYPFPQHEPRPCLRELVVLGRRDSVSGGMSGYEVRKAIGDRMAAECPASADLVTALARSAEPAALGYAQRMGLPLYPQLLELAESAGAMGRLGPAGREGGGTVVEPLVRGRRVVVVHDSIGPEVAWSSMLRTLRDAGVREIHVRLAAPPTRFPCIYGVALMPPAAQGGGRNAEDQRTTLDADSVEWLELSHLREAMQSPADNACDGCYSGHYPVVHEDLEQPQLPLFEG